MFFNFVREEEVERIKEEGRNNYRVDPRPRGERASSLSALAGFVDY